MERLYSLQLGEIISVIKKEGWSFFFICLYLFFEYVRPQSIYSTLDIFPWVPLILVLAVFFLMGEGSVKNKPNVLNKLIVLYAIIVLLSSIFSYRPSISFSNLRVFFDWFVIYFLIINIVNNEKRFFIFLFSYLIYSFKMSQHGFITWVNRGFSFTDWGVTGAPGWFHNSGEAGIQMCIFVPLSFFFLFAIRKYISKKWFFFLLLMPITGVGTIIASSSRGALVGLAGSGMWSLLRRPRVFIVGGIFLCFVAGIIYYTISPESVERFQRSGSDSTSLQRIERWEHGLDTL